MKRHETKERLLRVGIDQLSVSGLSGVTIGTLASASGLSKSGLFAHFKSKEQLQIELLDELAKTFQRTVVEPAMRKDIGLPRLRTLFALWTGWSIKAGLQGGCPIAAAMFELDDIDNAVRVSAARQEMKWRALLLQLVSEAMSEQHLTADTDAEQFVWELGGIYLSHHVSSRFTRDKNATARANRAFEALIARHTAESNHSGQKS